MAQDKNRIVWFDAVRGVSALIVCAGHLRAALFCDYGEIIDHRLWHYPFYFVTGLGHEAVMVFFVLSGFFVGGAVIRARERFRWTDYLLARLSRLWVVLVPAMVFTAIMDAVAAEWCPGLLEGAYAASWSSGPAPGKYSASFLTFLGNLAFLQTIETPVFGSNSPFWSLANEFWYYVLFPMMVGVVYPRLRLSSFFYAVLVLGLLWWLPHHIVVGGVVWLFGVLLYAGVSNRSQRERPFRYTRLFLAASLFAFSLLAVKSDSVRSLLPFDMNLDLLVGATFSILAYELVSHEGMLPRMFRKGAVSLSEVSYTLYLFHFPVVLVLAILWLRGEQYQPTAGTLLVYGVFLLAVVACAYWQWWLFESRTENVRRLFKPYIQRLSQSPQG